MLFVGRLQRFKGAVDLVEACMGLPDDGWELTMIGADTPTAPLGGSVRETIEAICDEDPRVRIEGPLPHEELQRRWASHDLLAIPSTFEVWSNVAIEAMRAGLPILATPVGGPAEIVASEETGWHTDGIGVESLRRALTRLLGDREAIERVRASGAIGERVRRLTDPEQTLAAYERMLDEAASASRKAPQTSTAGPRVTVVIPYFRTAAYVEEAVASALAQTHRDLDVLVVNDGSFEPEDEVLARLASPRVTVVTQPNRGETVARNLGIRLARGEFVALLDADNALEPEFVARALDAFRREPTLAYVTSWLTYVDEGGVPMTGPSAYAPLGNSVLPDDSANWDGDAIAIVPRGLFLELGYGFEVAATMQSDWELYRRLREDGRFGAVIPEPLARYRVRAESLTKGHDDTIHARSWDEARMRRVMRATRWTARNEREVLQ